MEQDNAKLMKAAAAKTAVDEMVKSGMKLGLGTGSTAIHAVRRVGELYRRERTGTFAPLPQVFKRKLNVKNCKFLFLRLIRANFPPGWI